MALTKQPITINFAKGLDTKTDPFQIAPGAFLALQNSVFDKAGQLTKRNGFSNITTLPNAEQTTLTTLKNNLLATGSNLYSYSETIDQWLDKGNIQPVSLSVLPVQRNSSSQTSPDMAVASNGLGCLVYEENATAYVQVVDTTTGQLVLDRKSIPSIDSSIISASLPRVLIFDGYFIVTYLGVLTGPITHLRYIPILIANPTFGAAADMATTVYANTGYDCLAVEDNTAGGHLYFSYSATASSVVANTMVAGLVSGTPVLVDNAHRGDLVSIAQDSSTLYVWITYYDASSTNGYTTSWTTASGSSFGSNTLPVTQIIYSSSIARITTLVNNRLLSLFSERSEEHTSELQSH